MNERIRELQSKSYLMCKQIVDDDGHVVVTPDKWFDKFAELIVRDFLDICKAEKNGYVDLRKGTTDFGEKNIYAEGEAASDRIRIIAKRRFGVE